ncbi:glyceraldehyde-3-phosphate dehydrogenase [Striga asiatica]|uniref:Glyceraldehyde-3-phosphate dehydrogenase n=1 Tax=Striga asiatica TaxID=4170 RepID=A0A5A7R8P2_STRAF|nr:glyceraldehyde-3-phosphate dehydrogenase [Striga asiatica]
MGKLLQIAIGQFDSLWDLKIRHRENLEGLVDAGDAVPPVDALNDAVLKALSAQGEGQADKAAAGVLPDGLRDEAAGGDEDAELPEGGLGVELPDLGGNLYEGRLSFWSN